MAADTAPGPDTVLLGQLETIARSTLDVVKPSIEDATFNPCIYVLGGAGGESEAFSVSPEAMYSLHARRQVIYLVGQKAIQMKAVAMAIVFSGWSDDPGTGEPWNCVTVAAQNLFPPDRPSCWALTQRFRTTQGGVEFPEPETDSSADPATPMGLMFARGAGEEVV